MTSGGREKGVWNVHEMLSTLGGNVVLAACHGILLLVAVQKVAQGSGSRRPRSEQKVAFLQIWPRVKSKQFGGQR